MLVIGPVAASSSSGRHVSDWASSNRTTISSTWFSCVHPVFLAFGWGSKSQLHYLRSINRKPQGLYTLLDRRARGLSIMQVPDKLFAQGVLI